MPEAYTPSAPNGVGTDDYRCFILDPKLEQDAFLTGTNILPGNPEVVHHVIMFQLPPDARSYAEQADAAEPGLGWTCFGNMGFGGGPGEQLDNAQWLGAWAPGGKEAVAAPGYGTRLAKGTQVVMQVHYNLLNGEQPDISAMQLRLAPKSADLTPLETMLLPAPVELPCRPGHDASPLCDRDAAVADVKARFGAGSGLDQRRPLLPVRRQGEAEPDLVVLALHPEADDHPRGGRPHAPARPVHQDRGQSGNAARRGPSWTSRSGTSTTRARPRSRRSTSTCTTRSR